MRLFVLALLFGSLTTAIQAERPPNVLVIIADDLGFSDLGSYGGEIETPHLDSLAENGLRYTQFYNTGRCWPTRSALLAGYYPQQIRRDAGPGLPKEQFGNRSTRPSWAPLIAQRLRKAGYRNYHSGKWHIDGKVLENGFDRSYHLKDQSRFFSPEVHEKDDVRLPPVKRGSGYYGTTAVADHAIECLKEHQRKHRGKPFFHYLAFAAPHFPLHALPEDIEKYRDRYLEGWDVLRKERLASMQRLGLLDVGLSEREEDIGPPYHFPDALEVLGAGEVNRPYPWDSLNDEQQRFQATKMAIHAAMVDRMDQEIGRVLAQLKRMKVFEDTLILFLSDNGASAEIMVRADGHDPEADPGSAPTYLCLGPGFSNAANTPFRRHKTWAHEGGIATPLIAHWPKGIDAKGEFRGAVGHVIDVFPTLLDLAGLPVRAMPGGPALPGRSLVSSFSDSEADLHDALFFYHEDNRALRQGPWKLVRGNETEIWSLYDLSKDRTERHDLAEQKPAQVQRLERMYDRLAEQFARTALGNP